MATKTKAKTKRRKCPSGYKWGELPAEEKDPTKGKGREEEKPIGGKPKMGCVLIEGVAKDKKGDKKSRP
jgi:hypothetical protein